MNTKKYVVAYHTVRYKSGRSVEELLEYVEKHGVHGTAVIHSILDDGTWQRVEISTKKGAEKDEN